MSERIYALLLKLYPRRFQKAYGDAMRQVFRDRLRTENKVLLWIAVLWDLLISLPREQWRSHEPIPITGYRLSEEAVQKLAKQNSPFGPIWGSMVCLILGLMMGRTGQAPLVWLVAILSAIGLGLVTFQYSGRRRARSRWSSFEIVLEPDHLLVKEFGSFRSIHKAEIRDLIELPGTGLVIQAHPPQRGVFIPDLLNGYQEIRHALLTGCPSTPQSWPAPHRFSQFGKVFNPLVLFQTMYALALLMRSPNYVIATTGLLAATLFVGLLFMVKRKAPFKVTLVPIALLIPIILKVVSAFTR